MLDISYIKDNTEKVIKGIESKNASVDVHKIIELDNAFRELSVDLQRLREKRNTNTSAISGKPTQEQIDQGKSIKEAIEKIESALEKIKNDRDTLLLQVPNIPKADVKIGKNEDENEIVKTVGKPTIFSFTPKDHVEIGKSLDIIDIERAAKVSGPRFGYLKNEGVLLEFALKRLAFDTLLKEGFTPLLPPVLIKEEIMKGLGYMENGEDENMYILDKDNIVLVGTAEQSMVPFHMNEVLKESDLPKRYVGFSTSFRREAGSYGKDTKGIFRVHQFDKVEMVSFVKEGEDDKEQEYLLSLEEQFFNLLEIPYQVVKMCTGDLGFPAARKYDLEAWMPSQNKYREVTSVSTVTDFQSRRLNIKYQVGNEKKFVSILNGTAYSMNRPIIAILENNQQADGSVHIPKILQPYIGKEKISIKQ